MLDHLTLDQKLGSVISWLQQYPELYNFLYELDKAGSGLFFSDPNHTISYNIAVAAQNGNALAEAACEMLNLLSPNHCEWALEHEGILRLKP